MLYFVMWPQDGLRLSIQFSSQPEYELDADTQEDKNKVTHLSGLIKGDQ